MTRPLLLDLFCGAGGAAMGYHRAGFDIIGVDNRPQPRYPFPFVLADALHPPFRLDGFAAIHASPPCQGYGVTKYTHPEKTYAMLIEPVRELLMASGRPYVMENVPRAPLLDPLVLCGTEFGLFGYIPEVDAVMAMRRHRLFESNVFLWGAGGCSCRAWAGRIVGVYGGYGTDRKKTLARRAAHLVRFTGRGGFTTTKAKSAELMGIDWMTRPELCEAIPPAYTEYLGAQLLAALGVAA